MTAEQYWPNYAMTPWFDSGLPRTEWVASSISFDGTTCPVCKVHQYGSAVRIEFCGKHSIKPEDA